MRSQFGKRLIVSLTVLAISSLTWARTGAIVAWGNNNVGQSTFSGTDTAIDVTVGGDGWAGFTIWIRADGTLGRRGWNDAPRVPNAQYVQVAAGLLHLIALRSDGVVVGSGSTHPYVNAPPAAYQIPGDLGACSQVAAGGHCSGALRADSTPAVWGERGTQNPAVGPCRQIGVGSGTLAVLKADRSVQVVWGGFGAMSVPESLGACTAIAVGDYHVVAIQESGTVVAWGQNSSGQCGTETERVGGSPDWTSDSSYGAYWVKSALGPCKSVSASSHPDHRGDSRNAAIKADGSIVVWGGGWGATPSTLLPDAGPCTKVVSGAAHVAAIQVPLPTITGVMPISGPSTGGTPITITGTDFFPYSTVLVGGAPATDVTVVSPTKITAITPPGFPGPAEVKVNLGSVTGFYYRPECGSDLDQNGVVDGGDMAILLLDWGPCVNSAAASGEEPPALLRQESSRR